MPKSIRYTLGCKDVKSLQNKIPFLEDCIPYLSYVHLLCVYMKRWCKYKVDWMIFIYAVNSFRHCSLHCSIKKKIIRSCLYAECKREKDSKKGLLKSKFQTFITRSISNYAAWIKIQWYKIGSMNTEQNHCLNSTIFDTISRNNIVETVLFSFHIHNLLSWHSFSF